MIVLDTNVISEAIKGNPHENVIEWLNNPPDTLVVTSITVGELLLGVALLPDGKRKRELTDDIERGLNRFPKRLAYDEDAARAYGEFGALARRLGRGLSIEDGMIAAICVTNGATLATRNTADFDFLPVAIINPWESKNDLGTSVA